MFNKISALTILACAGLCGASSSASFPSASTDTTVKVENNSSGGNGVGLSGKSITPGGIGLTGLATGTGATVGVRGYSKSLTGYGVHGTNDAGGKGVYGISTSGGHGVYGEATGQNGIGVEGRATNNYGLYGVRGVGPSIGVYGTTLNSGGEGVRGKSVDSVGVYAISTNGNAVRAVTAQGAGVYATSTGAVGVLAEGATIGVSAKVGTFGSFALYGEADLGNGAYGVSNRNFGVVGFGPGGVRGTAYYNGNAPATGLLGYGNGGAVAYGVIGTAESAAQENWAGYFDGNVAITGECSPCVISDVSTKKNIQPLKGSLDKVLAMKPKSYEMRQDEFAGRMTLAQGSQNGLIAQDLEAIVPEAVHTVTAPPRYTDDEAKRGLVKPSKTLKAVNYAALVPLLIAAIQEQQAQIEALKAGR